MTSLIETIIWAGLVVWLVIKFEKSIAEILATIKNRIESGGDVKLGPIELSEPKPQEPSQQAERVESEVKELISSQQDSLNFSESRFLRTNYVIAEELAIRAIESEFDKSIQRQVSWGNDSGFDGFFAHEGQGQIIEVKYFIKRIDYQVIKINLAKARESYLQYGWKNIRIIFVIVAEEEAFKSISQTKLEALSQELEIEVLFKSYSLKSLQERFGA